MTRQVSSPDVAKSRAGGTAMYTSTPAGRKRVRDAVLPRRANVPIIAMTTAAVDSTSAIVSTTYSSRPSLSQLPA